MDFIKTNLMKKNLPEVTMVAVACNRIGETISALLKSLQQITPARTILFTDTDLNELPGIEVIKIEKLDWRGYNEFIIKELFSYIKTDYVLVTQWDGYVLNGDCWTDEFYKWDFIGAKWLYKDSRNVGNGGFSLRSRKLQK